MQSNFCMKYKDEVKSLIKRLGIDETKSYLLSALSTLTRKVTELREEIYSLKESLNEENNSDEIRHLKYDLEEKQGLLADTLDELLASDSMYLCFKEYINK